MISVIVPCYNAEKYLADCLRSLQGQSDPDFEALLVDDGSADASPEILSRFAAEDRRFRVFTQRNAGVSAARNRALQEARGDWVFFLDADDLLPGDALKTLSAAAGEAVDLVVGTHTVFTEGSEETVWPEGGWERLQGTQRQRAAALRLIEGDSVLNIMCNKLHRRSLLEKEGLRLAEGLRVAEDNLFNLEAVLCGRGIAYVQQVTYRYRMHGGSVMHHQQGSQFDIHLPWLREMGKLLRRRGFMEAYYGAYLDSVTLRLYKDGGIPGVLRGWREKALPLAEQPGLDGSKMSHRDRRLYRRVQGGTYPFWYPAYAVLQIAGRKAEGLRMKALRRE
ncbi:MAG: glycosyltransferase family 2 protein [Clostridia bacterium]|nr:glycosyltransferase family 2 protein [Clostridia bacterium]